MATKLRLVFSITIAFLSFYGHEQNSYWKQESSQNKVQKGFTERFDIQKGTVFTFDEAIFKKELTIVSKASRSSKVLYFPNVEGQLIPFTVSESPVMSPELAAKFPEIKSFVGYGLNDKGVKIRFSVSHKGVQSMIIDSRAKGTVFMQKDGKGKYVVYNRDGLTSNTDFICETKSFMEQNMGVSTQKLPENRVLRKFRLAVSASGEYTNYHGGTKADAMAAINATLTRVNEVYETDFGVSLELIANNDDVVYTNAANDPYTGNLNAQVQDALDTTIGAENYDIGHLFHKDQNGGNAGFIGSVCRNNRKGSAYSSGENPEGDLFDIDFVSHEMGHQFGANHTWSFEPEGTEVQVEPASGTTIMGYAGITGNNNVAPNGDDYFHYLTIEQVSEYLTTVSCGAIVENLSNTGPEVVDVGDFIIPKSTAFVLEGSATDADVDNVLTYTWEQIDNGVVTRETFGPTNSAGANFRSLKPSISPIRYFPRLARVIQGNLTQVNPPINSAWETVSDIERDLNFAFTVRDNAEGGGQVASDEVKVSVVNSAGPFKVTSQANSGSFAAGSVQEIVWDVANTEKAPVNAANVDIFLSVNGGLTFVDTLALNTPNDGSHKVVLPGKPTTSARVMVKASDNIFYAVNTLDFTIQASEIVLNFSELEYGVCQPDSLVVPFSYETFLGFNEEVTLSAVFPPPGLNIAFSTTTVTNDTLVNITFSGTENLVEGNYAVRILASGTTISREVELNLSIFDTDFEDIVLVSPADGLVDSSLKIMVEWEEVASAISYDVEVATDLAFTNIVDSANLIANTYRPSGLDHETSYYWRVKPKNTCGEGAFGTPFSFTTIAFSCEAKSGDNLPLGISSTGTPKLTSKVVFREDLVLSDINVNLDIEHSYVSDLSITLTSPSGTTVALVSSSCGDLKDINATFDDDGDPFACSGNPAITGTVRPLGSLRAFEGESILGEWILEVSDNAPSDGGSVNNFSLEVCIEGEFRPDEDNDGVFDDGDDLCLGTPEGAEVDSTGCRIFRFPADNFSIEIQSESCRNGNDGTIDVTATLPLNYEITVTGNGTDVSQGFRDSFGLSNLAAGSYEICITAMEGEIEYEPNCFTVVVTEPDVLSVSSKADLEGRLITLNLEGAENYFIELNGKIIQTAANEITLDLKNGGNSLKVSTGLLCQGTYEEELFVSDTPLIYPNPFVDVTKAFLPTGLKDITVGIFSANGQFIKSRTYVKDGTELELDFLGLPSGMYYVKFEGPQIKAALKVIKK